MVDEAQFDYNWVVSAKNIYDSSNNIFMIFTGSSALNLEYNVDSARRLLKRNINSLTYSEYLTLNMVLMGVIYLKRYMKQFLRVMSKMQLNMKEK